MSCIAFPNFFSRIGNSCLHTFGLKRKPQPLIISAPFDFKEGPAFNLESLGNSEETFDLDLLREKAIASTAIVEDGESDYATRIETQSRSHTCGLRSRVVKHARKVSRGYLPTVV